MKKVLLLIASAALLLVGCAKEQGVKQADGEMVTTTFAVSMDNGVTTKAVADGDGAAASVNRCIMEIYYGDELYTRQIKKVTDKHATFTAQVVSNRTYKVAFWADCVDDADSDAGLAADKYYTTNAEGGLTAIALKGIYVGNDDARDAFFVCKDDCTVAQAGTAFEATLKRPFAQVNVITTDWDKVKTIEALKPEKVNVTIKNPMVKFNAMTGIAATDANIASLYYTADVYVEPAPTGDAPATDKTLSMDYLFASTTKGVIDIDWKALHGTDANVAHSFAAVPYQRNYRTNIKGALLTSTGNWTVTVDPIWASVTAGEYNIFYTAVANASDVKNAISGKSGDQSKNGQGISVTINNEVGTGATNDDIIIPDNTPKATTPEIILDFKKLSTNAQIVIRDQEHPREAAEATTGAKEYDGEVVVIVPEGTTAQQVKILTNKSTVTVRGKYGTVIASCAPQTIIVEKGTVISELQVMKGNVEVYGKVESIKNTTPNDIVYVYMFGGAVWTNVETQKNDKLVPLYPVAKIAEKYYFSLQDAVDAVPDNTSATITIISNQINATAIPEGNRTLTIDLGGKEVTVTGPAAGSTGTTNQAFQIIKGNTVTIKNGTLKCDNTGNIFRFVIQNYSDLTLEDVTVDGTNLKKEGRDDAYTVSSNYGNITFTGKTIVKASSVEGVKSYAIDLYDFTKNGYATPATGVWNCDSDGSVEGIINIGGGKLTVNKELKLNNPIKVYKGDSDNPSELIVKANILPVDGWNKENNGDAMVVVNRGGNLTISGNGKISSNNQGSVYSAVKMTEKGESETGAMAKLTVNEGTLEGYYYGIVGNGQRHNTEITINGGTVKGTVADDCIGIYHPQNGTLTINGGTVEGSTGLVLKGGQLVVNNGTIKGIGKVGSFSHSGSGWNNTGDALAVEACDYPGQNPPKDKLSVDIKGGTFTSANGKAVASYAQDAQHSAVTKFISGGKFNTKPDADYLADGKKAEQNSAGLWEIIVDPTFYVVEEMTETMVIPEGIKHVTLSDELAAVRKAENPYWWMTDEAAHNPFFLNSITKYVSLPASMNEIKSGMFEDSDLEEVVFDGTGNFTFGNCAFQNTNKVKKITFKNLPETCVFYDVNDNSKLNQRFINIGSSGPARIELSLPAGWVEKNFQYKFNPCNDNVEIYVYEDGKLIGYSKAAKWYTVTEGNYQLLGKSVNNVWQDPE